VGEESTSPGCAEEAMVITFGSGSGSCLVRFLCSNVFVTGIDYYTRHEVFGSLKVYFIYRFVLVLFHWFYFIHSIMGHRACSVFATPGMYGTFLGWC